MQEFSKRITILVEYNQALPQSIVLAPGASLVAWAEPSATICLAVSSPRRYKVRRFYRA